jgi:ABC-2 type transport system ATP-binding protein
VAGLLGRNGAGKTTLIHIAMGMLSPHGGSVRVFGLNPTEDPVAVKKRIGFVSEEQALPTRSTIADMIALHRYLFGRWDEALERQILDRFDLLAGSRIGRLSKGQARQVALLCAVCHRPELLVLDERAGGLDPVARREFLETAIQMLNREGTAILFSSHNMTDVERIGGRVVILDEGRVRIDRELDRLREEVCVTMVPLASASSAGAIERIPGCLRVRRVHDEWRAVMDGEPETATRQVKQQLGANGVRCVRVPLRSFSSSWPVETVENRL